MPKNRVSAGQIVYFLRQIEMLMAQGRSAPEVCRDAGISQQSYAMSFAAKSSTA
jgi:putative transposase